MNSKVKELVDYVKSLDIIVNTNTKARGHRGFFLNSKNRIDIASNLKDESFIRTLLHEFAHYVHSTFEKDIETTGGTLQTVFKTDDETVLAEIKKELVVVTHWIDESSLCKKLLTQKEGVKVKIKELDNEIKKDFPKFQRSKGFKEFDKVIKKSDAKYLLKCDRVRICGWFFQKDKTYSIDNIEHDFPELKPAFVAYIKLRSYQRKQSRISSRLNKINKYYERPTELFARFVEAYYKDKNELQNIAPVTSRHFETLLLNGVYGELKNVLQLLKVI